ncbi:hypothetical protein ACHAWX_001881 [Stephanocyclus meneghinianus]
MTIVAADQEVELHSNTKADSGILSRLIESKACQEIRDALPDSTPAERLRFLASRSGNSVAAIVKLNNYLDWRREHFKGDSAGNNRMWESTCKQAIQMSKDETANCDTELPCVLFVHEFTDATSKLRRCIQVLPPRVDTNLASHSAYALAIAMYLDRVLDRDSDEKVTLAIDVRVGKGWANISAFKLLPFIKSTTKFVSELHPERLERCIIFPVPSIAVGIWRAVKPFLDKETAGKVFLIPGPAGADAGLPETIPDVLNRELIEKLERMRRDCQG